MGLYINPRSESKEEFLKREGTPSEPRMPDDDSLALVCLVDNRIFTAAGCVYSQRELEDFTLPDDTRPKQWYTVPKRLLFEVCGVEVYHYYPELKPN